MKGEETPKTPKFVDSGQNLQQRVSDLEEQNRELRKDKEAGREREEELMGIILRNSGEVFFCLRL